MIYTRLPRLLAILAVGVAAVAATSLALAEGTLNGKYATTIKSPPDLKGTWALNFQKGGNYTVALNGKALSRGKYSATATTPRARAKRVRRTRQVHVEEVREEAQVHAHHRVAQVRRTGGSPGAHVHPALKGGEEAHMKLIPHSIGRRLAAGWLAVLTLLLAGLAGCGGSDD